jgi:hypothetical protein
MTRRQLGFVFGLLAGLTGAWFALRGDGLESGPAGATLDIAAALGSDVSQIRIVEPDSAVIRLEIDDGRWMVNGYVAEDSLLEAMLSRMAAVAPARVIARNPANHARLGVADDSTRRVEIGPAGNPVLVFLLGKAGPEGRFVRLPDRPEVYVVESAAVRDLDRNQVQWRDPTIASVDTAALHRIAIKRGIDPFFDLRRDQSGAWRLDGVLADTAVIRVFLETMVELRATGFPADSFVFAVDFDRPDAILNVYSSTLPTDPPSWSLLFATADMRPEVLVRRADDPIAYAIDPGTANLLVGGRSRWRAAPQ